MPRYHTIGVLHTTTKHLKRGVRQCWTVHVSYQYHISVCSSRALIGTDNTIYKYKSKSFVKYPDILKQLCSIIPYVYLHKLVMNGSTMEISV